TGLAIQNDGKIVTTQTAASLGSGGGVKTFSVARFNANGGLDTTFDGDGVFVSNTGLSYGSNIAIAPSGRYFVLAVVDGSPRTTGLYQYSPVTGDWASITTIGTGGFFGWANGLAVQSDGKVLVSATTSSNGTS